MIYWIERDTKEMKAMETATPARSRTTPTLILVVLILAAVLAAMIFMCRPYFGEEETVAPTAAPTTEPTEEPTEPPTEPEPTEPPADPNPYGIYDFQFEGKYLKLLEGESITGIDVSHYQGTVDWQKVKESGVEFVIIRLVYRGYSVGSIMEDPNFAVNFQGAKDAGLKVGVYFFSQAVSVEEAQEEADFVLEKLAGAELEMPIVYDWEYISDTARTANVDRRTLTDCSLAFLQKVEEAGYWPMLYFNTLQSRKMLYLNELNQYDFWLALYSHRMTFPYKIKMWQYTCEGRVPGIEGNVDINVFFPET